MPRPRQSDAGPSHVFVLLERLRRRADADVAAGLTHVPGMRGSFGRILGTLPSAGSRASDMAGEMGITKQSLGERLRELEDRGWIESAPDPADGRARIIRRTRAGDRIRDTTERAIAEVERSWADQVGPERYDVFISVLRELGSEVTTDPTPS